MILLEEFLEKIFSVRDVDSPLHKLEQACS